MRHPMRQAELANQPMSRRMVLIASGVVASMTGLMAWGGERIIARRTSPGSIALPPPADPAPPLPRGIEQSYRGISRLQTPTDPFYRVDTNLNLPVVSVDHLTLHLYADVAKEFTLPFQQTAPISPLERDSTGVEKRRVWAEGV